MAASHTVSIPILVDADIASKSDGTAVVITGQWLPMIAGAKSVQAFADIYFNNDPTRTHTKILVTMDWSLDGVNAATWATALVAETASDGMKAGDEVLTSGTDSPFGPLCRVNVQIRNDTMGGAQGAARLSVVLVVKYY